MVLKVQFHGTMHEQLIAATVGANQSETPIPSTRHLIGSRQLLLQTVAQCIATFMEIHMRIFLFKSK